jgi:hypothetical protein
MLDKAEELLDKHHKKGAGQATARSFTGGDGLKMKVSIMEAFTSFADLPGEPVWNTNSCSIMLTFDVDSFLCWLFK